MPALSFSLSSLFSRPVTDRLLPVLPLPVRGHYKTPEELQLLASALARNEAVRLPDYEKFDFNKRLAENAGLILHAYRSSDAASRNGETITPAAQWLLDNYYVVDKSMQQARRDLPDKFLRQLPLAANISPDVTVTKGAVTQSDTEGLPRVFALAWLYVAHSDSNFSLKSLKALIDGFQSVEPLRIGELWALPSVIRFMLVENARRLALRVERARAMRDFANRVADKIVVAGTPEELQAILTEYSEPAHDGTFATHLLYRLRSSSTATGPAIDWLEAQLESGGRDVEEIIVEEHARQSTGGVTMGNIVRSLKAIDDVDWTSWVETVSIMDAILRENSDFEDLDFASRNSYRVTIEKIARNSTMTEIEVTNTALKLAQEKSAREHKITEREQSGAIAYYLNGNARTELEQVCGYKPTLSSRILRAYRGLGLWGIAVPVWAMTLGLLALIYIGMGRAGFDESEQLLFTLLALFPAYEASLGLFNSLVPWFVQPNRLVGYEYRDGLPADARTLVAVPTLINSRDSVDEHIRNLEVHYLTNPRGEVYFAIVSDWTDSKVEVTPADMEVLDYAREEVAKLNEHYAGTDYASNGQARFYFLHRRRLYNPSQNCWMGWERKRGKLHELNLLLRGDHDTSFFPPDVPLPRDIRYVMTLDSDTRLTPQSVTNLVGKLSHPLNHPVFDEKTGRITSGYGILQPRVTPSLTTGDEASFLQRVFSANRGIDPYVFAVSDVYQDLLGEGTFTGKGLYDIDAFEKVMKGKIEENTVLSHDLLEGGYARCALASDVEVVEDYPTGYNVDISRHHRWARGDWQLLPFLFSTGKGVSNITRWKMADNLRRSLNPILWVIASFAGWCFLPLGVATIWQLFLILAMFVPMIFGIVTNLIPVNMDYSLKGHAQSVLTDVTLAFADIALRLSFIAHSATLMGDAITRTFYRLFVSRRNLLAWRAAAQMKSSDTLDFYVRLMWPSLLIGALAFLLPVWAGSKAVLIAVPFAVIWIASPWIAWAVSRSAKPQDTLEVRSSDKGDLRRYARRTWRYFEAFTNEENSHLPPDNYQEDPVGIVAMRTSPTNIGVYLLSVISARDFGWICFNDTLNRIGLTLDTLEKMDKFRGHLYNWYETDTLKPLQPLYVSAVDSGNLAGHLVTLSSALEEWAQAPSVYLQGDFEGILDVNDILEEAIAAIPDDRRILRPLRRRLEERIGNFRRAVRSFREEPETASFRTINISLFAKDIEKLAQELDDELETPQSQEALEWARALVATCKAHTDDAIGEHNAEDLRAQLQSLATRSRQLAFDMEFGFLERKERRLLSIGFRVQENELDESCYDLLASEARLASLFAIAKGDVPVEHWFKLGRLLVPVGWKGALLSWSGSMFEYLMPPLVMNEPLGSLLDQTNKLVVQRQIEYASSRGLPWGISEAAYNARDPQMNYQYSNFGVPKLGLQRGLSRNAVIAPYASLLASQYRPAEAVTNLKALEKLGALGRYGFHDSVDFTPSRVREGEKCAVVKNYYAHHHGMSIIAVNNVIFDGRMRTRFHSDPVIEAAELLLQEKAPREIPMVYAKTENPMRVDSGAFDEAPMRIIEEPLKAPRSVHLMSNGQYSLMLTAAGNGYSRWQDLAITRFQPDASEGMQGSFLFLRDVENGRWWSATGEPSRHLETETKTVFTEDKAEFYKTSGDIKTVVETIVTTDADGEGRRIDIINTSARDRVIEVTSYAELVLNNADTDDAHPAFAKMFVETEIAPDGTTIYAKRRKRAPTDTEVHVAHFVTDLSGAVRETEAETDRRVFIGRGRTLRNPAAFDVGAQFTGSQGTVLDAVASLRTRVRVPARKKVSLVFWTLAGGSRSYVEEKAALLRYPEAFSREYTLSWTRSQVRLHHVGIQPSEATDYQKTAAYLIYPDRSLRQPSEVIAAGLGAQSDLWPLSISGDYPMFVLRIDNEADLDVLRGVLKAQEYWREKGLIVDVVVVNERAFSYAQDTQRAVEWMTESFRVRSQHQNQKPHIFTVRRDQMSEQSYNTLLAAARIVIHAQNGSLAEQLKRIQDLSVDLASRKENKLESADPRLSRRRIVETDSDLTVKLPGVAGHIASSAAIPVGNNLEFWNGYGGFDATGDYVVRLNGDRTTPHPWINVIANADFGFHVSAEGSAFTWSGNSRDYQLTPWSNDPVSNLPGEAVYIADRDSGKVFAAAANVVRDESVTYEARHGQGFSIFTSRHGDVSCELTMLVDPLKPVRLTRLRLINHGQSLKSLRLYNYAEWVLGNVRAKNAAYIVPRFDEELGTLFARNPYHTDKAGQVAFLTASVKPDSVTADRQEFIGTTGSVTEPDSVMQGKSLKGTVEAGRDPCAALSYDLELNAGQSKDITFILGNAKDEEAARGLITYSRGIDVDALLEATKTQWQQFTAPVQVKTPDRAFDLMVNRWLPYQSMASRILARAAFYQASGAYGFRDQLQDTLSLLMLDPQLARKQLLNVAGRQFPEGDVQHWWLPGTGADSGAGVRTLISDDVVWLSYAASLYVQTSGDVAVLDEVLPYLQGRALGEGEHDAFYQPEVSSETASVYEHCIKGLELAIKRTGSHGLPLMLGGDWNDGMNLVGVAGKGESVWLGWFLSYTLQQFIPIAEARGDTARVVAMQQHLASLNKALEESGWDGEWYRRGYFDDGAPLGSHLSDECQIDAIAQSWAVLSGAADPARANQAMASLEKHLLDEEGGLLRLFTPPFDKSEHEPGYIKGYPRGVRENGGQYTHGATWAILALTKLGRGDEAYKLFSLINPVNHGAKPETYRVEPYVIAADIYSVEPRRGQGGWTWYTGSAGWFYRVATEGILGLTKRGNSLFLNPALPSDWNGFELDYRHGEAVYKIIVRNNSGRDHLSVDGKVVTQRDAGIALSEQGTHEIVLELK